MEQLLTSYAELLQKAGLSETWVNAIENTSLLIVILLLAFLADRITKGILLKIIGQIVKRSKNTFDDKLLENKVFSRLAHIAPALVINAMIVFLVGPAEPDVLSLASIVRILTKLYIVVIVTRAIVAVLKALHDIYMQLPISNGRNIKGYVQLGSVLVYLIAALIIISILTSKSIDGLLTGLGAFAAVLMLVFKDTILGLVASVQLAGNDMVKIGDWISMPSHHADGDVIDIGLYTVKVQNWDKTIATIPTYALVQESFNNWRGMSESGGRRIKRSINIDMQSVQFIDKDLLEKLKKMTLLKPYLEEKLEEIENVNKKLGIDAPELGNGRNITNLGTFRRYLELYLQQHPKINQDMTFLVRHLQPSEKGIPMEIYVFSNDQDWNVYEAIQADIFDHVLAVIHHFNLRVFQNPTGEDWRSIHIGSR